MANVLISLSNWSTKAILWMIMLSARFTLNLTFPLEYEWPRPSSVCLTEAMERPFTKWVRCVLMPRITCKVKDVQSHTFHKTYKVYHPISYLSQKFIISWVKTSRSSRNKSHLRDNTNVSDTKAESFIDGSSQLGINNTKLECLCFWQVGLQEGTKGISQYSYKTGRKHFQ